MSRDLKAAAQDKVNATNPTTGQPRGMAAGFNATAGELATLIKSVADIVAAMTPEDPCFIDIQDAFKAYGSCCRMPNPNTTVQVYAGKVLQLCQLRDGETITPLPEKYSLEKKATVAVTGKLAADAAAAQEELRRLNKQAASQSDDPPSLPTSQGE
jgi:hypothetical protein